MRNLKLPAISLDDDTDIRADNPHQEDKGGNKKKRVSFKVLFVAMAVAFLVGGALFVTFLPAETILTFRRDLARKIDPGYIDTSALTGEFKDIANLTTVDYKYKSVGDTGAIAANVLGINVPFTEKRLLVTYEGEIFAGIDLANMKSTDIQVNDKVVTVTLPKATVLSNAITPGSEKCIEEQETLFNQLTEDEREQFRTGWVNEMQTAAISDGLLTKAEDNAKAAIEKIATDSLPEGYSINVAIKDSDA